MSLELILPFLRPIEQLILDPEVSDILVNQTSVVFVERQGELSEVPGVLLDQRHLRVALQNIARSLGDDFSEAKPILDARLPDGSRISAVMPPCSVGGITLSIRKFQRRYFNLEELARTGFLPESAAGLIREAIAARRSILISGGTGSGKTTLLNAALNCVEPDQRLVIIEDTVEIQTDRSNVVRFEARPAIPPLPAVSIRDLLKASLRNRPDRIVVGEVRGGEAFDLLQAMNTGHAGSLATIHANSAVQALTRLQNCVLQAGIVLSHQAVRGEIADAVDYIVQIERQRAKRLVVEIIAVRGFDHLGDEFDLEPVYVAQSARRFLGATVGRQDSREYGNAVPRKPMGRADTVSPGDAVAL